jgi:hypothetical protein
VVAGIGLFMGYGAVISFTFGVFSNPLAKEFNWSRTEISLAYSLSLIVYCLATPLLGRLIDRVGARKIILPSVLIFGLCLISFQLLAGNLWHFYTIYIVMGLVGGGNSLVPYSGGDLPLVRQEAWSGTRTCCNRGRLEYFSHAIAGLHAHIRGRLARCLYYPRSHGDARDDSSGGVFSR